MPDISEADRNRAIALQAKIGNEALYKRLQECDPKTAQRLDIKNTQRLVRAWEVWQATGKGLSDWQDEPLIAPPEHLSFFYVTLLLERDGLYKKCNTRFNQMIERGALEEVRHFAEKIDQGDVPETCQLTKALGFANLRDYLKGKCSLEDAVERATQQTRNYAKRQVTWFRNQGKPDLVLQTHDVARVLSRVGCEI